MFFDTRRSLLAALFVASIAACGASSRSTPHIGASDGGADEEPTDDAGADPDGGSRPDAKTDCGTPGNGPSITVGAKDRVLLTGTVVTPDTVFEGQVLVEGANVTCAAAGTTCEAAAGANGATIIDTDGIIAPGLIDTHNHILFDIFDDDDWHPAKLYVNHNEWTTEPRYQAMLDVKQCLANDSQGKPAWCAQTPYGTANGSLRCEMDKYGELKAMVAGTTSVVGLPGTSQACFGSLARSIDVAQNELGTDKMQTSAIFPPSTSSANGVCTNFSSQATTAYLVHCGEGTDAAALAEFATLGSVSSTPNCLYAQGTTITHGTAFGASEFAQMAAANMKLTWSPRSNVSLYGKTTDIPAALDAGVTIALGADWSMGGSQNMLDEMRFAKEWSDAHFSGRLAAKDIVLMATKNGAEALALSDRLGEIAPGKIADLAVFAGDRKNPYDAIVAAKPKDVRLVMIGGRALFGDKTLVEAAPTGPACEDLDVCGASKFVCVATSTNTSKLDQTLAQIRSALDEALTSADALTSSDGWSFAPLAPLVTCP